MVNMGGGGGGVRGTENINLGMTAVSSGDQESADQPPCIANQLFF